MTGRPTAVSFTGGKDSTLVLHLLRCKLGQYSGIIEASRAAAQPGAFVDEHGAVAKEGWEDIKSRLAGCGDCDVKLLVTFVPAGGKPFKAHPLELISLQAQSLGLTHIVKEISAPFLDSYRSAITSLRTDHGIELLATGDILDVCEGFMGRASVGTGVELITPLWSIDRHLLLAIMWHYKIQALITCVNTSNFKPKAVSAAGKAKSDGPACEAGPTVGSGADAVRGGAEAGLRKLQAAAQSSQGASAAASSGAAATAPSVASAPSGAPVAASSNGNGTQQQAPPAQPQQPVHNSPEAADGEAGSKGHESMPSFDATAQVLGQELGAGLVASVLEQAHSAFGVDICGEGGEFHTMVLHGELFGSKIELPAYEKQVEGDFAFLKFAL